MRTTSLVRVFLAGCYLAIYAGVFAVAWHGRHGVGGGMAFTLPVVLGFPWTFLVVPALVQLGFKPNPDDAAAILPFIAIFIVPVALNVLTILFVGRRRRTPPRQDDQGAEPSRHRPPRGPEA